MNEQNAQYQGWTNYETWNVMLYISNDEGLYNLAKKLGNYDELLKALDFEYNAETPDGVRWTNPLINREEVDEAIKEL